MYDYRAIETTEIFSLEFNSKKIAKCKAQQNFFFLNKKNYNLIIVKIFIITVINMHLYYMV